MNDLDALRRQYDRLSAFSDFRPEDRIWWIYLRAEVETVLARQDLPVLQAACDRLKSFPENMLDERVRWMELRDEVARVLERT